MASAVPGPALQGARRLFFIAVGLAPMIAIALLAGVELRPRQLEARGVRIEKVEPGTPLARAGLKVGDRIVSWSRSLSAQEPREGAVDDPIDWRRVEVTQGPAGVTLLGWRGDQPMELAVATDGWDVQVRSLTSPGLPLAVDDPERTLAACTGAAGSTTDLERRSFVWMACGERFQQARDLERAAIAFSRALDLFRDTDSRLGVALALHSHGELALLRGDLQEARDLLQSALEIRQADAPGSLGFALTLRKLGVVARRLGSYDEAQELYERALALVSDVAAGGELVVILLNNLGVVAQFTGDQLLAERYLERSLEHLDELERRGLSSDRVARARGISLGNLAGVSYKLGKLDAANACLAESIRLNERHDPNGRGLILNLSDKALLELEIGEIDRAESLLRRALRLERQRVGSTPLSATLLNRLAGVAEERENPAAAEDLYLEALAVLEREAPDSLNLGAVLGNLANLLLDRDDPADAEAYLRRALDHYRRVAPGSLDLVEVWTILARAQRAQGRPEEASLSLSKSIELASRLAPNGHAHAEARAARGLLQLSRGDSRFAIQELEVSVRLYEGQARQFVGARQGAFRAQKAAAYKELIDAYLRSSEPATAFRVLERYRAGGFVEMLAEREHNLAESVPPHLASARARLSAEYERVQQRMAGLSVVRDGDRIDALNLRLEELTERREALIAEIRRQSPRIASIRYPEPICEEDLSRVLDTGTALLSYGVFSDQSVLFAWSHEMGLRAEILNISEESLRDRVDAWRQLVQLSARPSGLAARHRLDLARLSRSLFDLLVKPAEGILETARRVLVLPDGPLHQLPFGALVRVPSGSAIGDGRYFVEWKPLHVALSVTAYHEARRFRETTASGQTGDPLLAAFADPVAAGGRGSGTSLRLASIDQPPVTLAGSLPHARQEIARVASLFPDERVRIFLGRDATEEVARSRVVERARIVHFATHARTNERLPMDSAIVLSQTAGAASSRHDGLLQVWEIFDGLRLRCELAVLSSCGSALGKEAGSDGLVSLTRALQYAGAQTVLASVWNVSDRVTPELIVRFYDYFLEGASKDDALRRAQMDLIADAVPVERIRGGNSTPRSTAAPYYWAAFQLYGDWR